MWFTTRLARMCRTAASGCSPGRVLVSWTIQFNVTHNKSVFLPCVLSIVDCSSATLSGQYIYTVPSPSGEGAFMNVSCVSGYVWTTSPYNSAHSATCTNESGSGQWLIDGGVSCVGKPVVSLPERMTLSTVYENWPNHFIFIILCSGLLGGDNCRRLQLLGAITRNAGNRHIDVVCCGLRVESVANWRRTQRHLHECERQRPVASLQ